MASWFAANALKRNTRRFFTLELLTLPNNMKLATLSHTVLGVIFLLSYRFSSSSAQNYQLVWQDEFTGPDIDPAKWTHEVDCWGGGNNEAQCYVNDRSNSWIENGSLIIRPIYFPGGYTGKFPERPRRGPSE